MNQVTASSPTNEGAVPYSSAGPAPPHMRIVPHLDSPRSLHFDVIDRDVPESTLIKIGRFTDRVFMPNRITFKSKVVSRGHAEIWTDGGKFYIRDTKSSSGTFLNHIRLSPPNQESRPFLLKDGDVIQLGVDYQGGTEEIYRCVKMKLELNRSWQQQLNPYCVNTFQNLRNIITPTQNPASSNNDSSATGIVDPEHIEDCCICLYAIAPFQALFIAPCSHSYHYKCIRPLLQNHPGFNCPLCRTYADLEASVAIEASEVIAKYGPRTNSTGVPVVAESGAVMTAEPAPMEDVIADNGQDNVMADAAPSSARPPASTARSDSPSSDGGLGMSSASFAPPDVGNRTVVESAAPVVDTFVLSPQSSVSSTRPIPINTSSRSSASHVTEHSIASPSTMVSPVHPSLLSNTLPNSPPPGFTSLQNNTASSQSRRNNSIGPNNLSPGNERQGFNFLPHLTAPLSLTVSTSTSGTDEDDYMDVGEVLSSSPPSSSVLNSTGERRNSASGLVGKLKMAIFDKNRRPGHQSPGSTSPVLANAPRDRLLFGGTVRESSTPREGRDRSRDEDQLAFASPSSVTSYLTSPDEEASSASSSDDKPTELEDDEVVGNSQSSMSRKRPVRAGKGKAVNVGQILEGIE